MTCREAVALLSDYIDGSLPPAPLASVEEHIASCQSCHVVLDSTRCAILLSRAAGATGLDGDRRRHLLNKLETACRKCGRSRDSGNRSS